MDGKQNQQQDQPVTFSLRYAQVVVKDGQHLFDTNPTMDGTLGAPTSYNTGRDGIVVSDSDETTDE